MMESIEDLRKWAKDEFLRKYQSERDRERLHKVRGLADAIEQEFKDKAERYFAEGLRIATDDILSDLGLIRLPLDADGVPVHVGDELCNYTLSGYPYPKGGVYCKAVINERMILVGKRDAKCKDLLVWEARWCRHHRSDTWERIITDACGGTASEQSLIDRCKALAKEGA